MAIELKLIPEIFGEGMTYLRESYTFSGVANGQDNIIIGRLDTKALEEENVPETYFEVEISKPNKLFIPDLESIPTLAALMENGEKTLSFGKLIDEYYKICNERSYIRISREQVLIERIGGVYQIKNLQPLGIGGDGRPGVILYDPSTKEERYVKGSFIELKNGVKIGLGYSNAKDSHRIPLVFRVELFSSSEKRASDTGSFMAVFDPTEK